MTEINATETLDEIDILINKMEDTAEGIISMYRDAHSIVEVIRWHIGATWMNDASIDMSAPSVRPPHI